MKSDQGPTEQAQIHAINMKWTVREHETPNVIVNINLYRKGFECGGMFGCNWCLAMTSEQAIISGIGGGRQYWVLGGQDDTNDIVELGGVFCCLWQYCFR